MKVEPGPLPGLLLIEPAVHVDGRGSFREAWEARRYAAIGLPPFVQDNLVDSRHAVLRGLHFQHPNGQAKLVQVLLGAIFDVVVDVRTGSPTRGRYATFELSDAAGRQLFIPAGFAHGYVALSDRALVSYRCSVPYSPADEHTLLWSDPDLAIPWPLTSPTVSERDARGARLRDAPGEWFPHG